MEILQIGNPVLRQTARELTIEEILSPKIQELILNMRDTMRQAPGVGLAAPQIGEPLQIAVIEDKAEYIQHLTIEERQAREREPISFHVIINPKLTIEKNAAIEFYEGCLSLTGHLGLVPRAHAVKVTCLNEHGQEMTIYAQGWYARILQHEIDHLQGHVYIDKMKAKTLTTLENYKIFWKNHNR